MDLIEDGDYRLSEGGQKSIGIALGYVTYKSFDGTFEEVAIGSRLAVNGEDTKDGKRWRFNDDILGVGKLDPPVKFWNGLDIIWFKYYFWAFVHFIFSGIFPVSINIDSRICPSEVFFMHSILPCINALVILSIIHISRGPTFIFIAIYDFVSRQIQEFNSCKENLIKRVLRLSADVEWFFCKRCFAISKA